MSKSGRVSRIKIFIDFSRKNNSFRNFESPKNNQKLKVFGNLYDDKKRNIFVAKDTNGYTHYYQVCLTMREESTRTRELSALMNLKNHHPKTIICLDPEEPIYNGIVPRNATKWLLNL
jgi:predicted AAA+ superfamily ATPase